MANEESTLFCVGMSRALKPCFRSFATFKFVVNVGKLETETNSCGIARFPCDSMVFLLKNGINFSFTVTIIQIPGIWTISFECQLQL